MEKRPKPVSVETPAIESLPIISPVDQSTTTTTTTNKSFLDQLKGNQYFGAGFALVGLGALLGVLRKATSLGYSVALRRWTTSLEVLGSDEAYAWTLRWVDRQLAARARHINVKTDYSKQAGSSRVSVKYTFMPSAGVHYLRYGAHYVKVERSRSEKLLGSNEQPLKMETLKMTALGRDPGLFKRILNEARDLELSVNEGKTLIYMAGIG